MASGQKTGLTEIIDFVTETVEYIDEIWAKTSDKDRAKRQHFITTQLGSAQICLAVLERAASYQNDLPGLALIQSAQSQIQPFLDAWATWLEDYNLRQRRAKHGDRRSATNPPLKSPPAFVELHIYLRDIGDAEPE